MSPPFLRLATVVVTALFLFTPTMAQAGEAHYLLMFASQRVPANPDYSHTFTVFVHATWAGDGPTPSSPTLEYHTISWLPTTGVVRTLARAPEPGRNFGLHETIRLAHNTNQRISLWGPYLVKPDLYARGLRRIAELETGKIAYKANDACYRSDQVVNCINTVSAVVEGDRFRLGSPGWGEIASFAVLKRMRPWILDETPQHWVSSALGLDDFPIIYRDRFTGPNTGVLAALASRLFGPERHLGATYGPPR